MATAAVATGVTGALVAADRLGGELRWRRRETVVDFCGERPPDGESAWLGLPGLGCESSQGIMETLEDAFEAPVSYLQLPQKSPSLEAVGGQVAEFIAKIISGALVFTAIVKAAY